MWTVGTSERVFKKMNNHFLKAFNIFESNLFDWKVRERGIKTLFKGKTVEEVFGISSYCYQWVGNESQKQIIV